MSSEPLCPLFSIPCAHEASVSTGGLEDHLAWEVVARPSAGLGAEAGPPAALFLRQPHTSL